MLSKAPQSSKVTSAQRIQRVEMEKWRGGVEVYEELRIGLSFHCMATLISAINVQPSLVQWIQGTVS